MIIISISWKQYWGERQMLQFIIITSIFTLRLEEQQEEANISEHFPTQLKYDRLQSTDRNIGNLVPCSFFRAWVLVRPANWIVHNEELRDGALYEKARDSNHLKM